MRALILFSIALSLMLTNCNTKGEQEIIIVPRNFKGYVIIIHNQKDGMPTKYEGNKRVYEIPKNGILKTQFKPKGPKNSTKLINNFDIDNTMEQWSLYGQSEFNKKFKAVSYQMIDFNESKNELRDIDLFDAKNKIEKPDTEKKITKPQSKFGVLGKDLSSQFSARGDRAWRPTKPGGRNGQGKPS
jgi:hypothetical protein